MITIVDYGVGNIASLINMLDHLGFPAEASGDPAAILNAERLILPGVGAFDTAMDNLDQQGLIDPLRTVARQLKTPILGVCLGMQLLARRSEEGVREGLGLIDADVVRIPAGPDIKIPHIGWAVVKPAIDAPLFAPDQPERFYFVHSYHVKPVQAEDVAATVHYGADLCVAVAKANVHGVQFHPEKSHRYGMRLLQKFAEFRP